MGLARMSKWRNNSWETEVNICLCSLAISHKNSFCGRVLSGQTVAKARHEVPSALQGKVGLFPAETKYQPLGPGWHRGQDIPKLLQLFAGML